jgi:hypothetical protein
MAQKIITPNYRSIRFSKQKPEFIQQVQQREGLKKHAFLTLSANLQKTSWNIVFLVKFCASFRRADSFTKDNAEILHFSFFHQFFLYSVSYCLCLFQNSSAKVTILLSSYAVTF